MNSEYPYDAALPNERSLFDNMDFKIVEINGIHEIILGKPSLVMTPEFVDCSIKPDWLAQIELIAYGV